MEEIFEGVEKLYIDKYEGWSGADQFKGSGARLRRLVDEMCWSPERIDEELTNCFKAVFPDSYEEMLVIGPIQVWTLCPHHLLPCSFKVYIGYIPSGQVLGLSKFARVSVILGKRPIMQEQYTRELADRFMEKLKPRGIGIYVVGQHGCMGCRGVTQELHVSTSHLAGAFMEEAETRAEFFKLVGK